jgi:hypothetical protein
MCNRVVQNDVVIKPGEKAKVLMRGPQGDFEMEFTEAVFGGPARVESKNYWLKREHAEEVRVPNVSRFGEKDKITGAQNWEDVPAGSSLDGLLLPLTTGKNGKDYRLLKVVTQPATPEQIARLGNDRAPIVSPPPSQPH